MKSGRHGSRKIAKKINIRNLCNIRKIGKNLIRDLEFNIRKIAKKIKDEKEARNVMVNAKIGKNNNKHIQMMR